MDERNELSPITKKKIIIGASITTSIVVVLLILGIPSIYQNSSDNYWLNEVSYSDTTDTFYFLDFTHENDYKVVTWNAPVGVDVVLMTYQQFNSWYLYGSKICQRILDQSSTESFYFSDLPFPTTDPPQNALVILFDASTPRSIEITIENYYWKT